MNAARNVNTSETEGARQDSDVGCVVGDLEVSGALETPNENCMDGPDTETSEMAIVDADPSLA